MPKSGYSGLKRIIKATGYSLQGLHSAWKHETAFRQETILAITLTPCALWLGQNTLHSILLIGTLILLLIVELLNSALETVVDRIGNEQHKLSGRAKDMGSAAVLLTLILTIIVWATIIWEHFGPQALY